MKQNSIKNHLHFRGIYLCLLLFNFFSINAQNWDGVALWGGNINNKTIAELNEEPIDIALGDYVQMFQWCTITKVGISLDLVYIKVDQVIDGTLVNTWKEPGTALGTNKSNFNAIAPNEAALTAPGPAKYITFTIASQDAVGNDLPTGLGNFRISVCKVSDDSEVRAAVYQVNFITKVKDILGGNTDQSIHGTGRNPEKDYEKPFTLITPSTVIPEAPLSQYEWSLAEELSDEFDGSTVDQNKWDNKLPDWGTTPCWVFTEDNTVIENGELNLQVTDEGVYQDAGRSLYLKSGAARTWNVVTYGYFECRMKSTDLIPGTCPAFWMYSKGGYGDAPFNHGKTRVQYSEIDGIEVGQSYTDKKRVLRKFDMNLHTYHLKPNGAWGWTRGVSGGDITRGDWFHPDLSFDIRDDYHTYGIWNRSDSIIWYVDGVKRNAKKNLYWHLPMRVIVSLGIRPPYCIYKSGGFTEVDPSKVAGYVKGETFKVPMKVDYVRGWKLKPQIVAKDLNLLSDVNTNFGSITFEGEFNAGSGELVTSDNGVVLSLIEKDDSGNVVRTVKTISDATKKDLELGKLEITMDLSDVPSSGSLPSNHYYDLAVSLTSSYNKGTEVILTPEGQQNITTEIIKTQRNESWIISPNPAKSKLQIKNLPEGTIVKVFDMAGKLHLFHAYNNYGINISELKPGIYMVEAKNVTQKLLVN
ncbi:family 16 glycosylhydrolase [Saccharicrinis aurantiacus]|uniref:family 16 glycosylhydrolase n=1 Tax=Saccharicrinis aurantiacus TaxID=1849719 RepID=UPI000838BC6E|nr:family 16 glycosylhydrolase [Saccharicrinis aurantiacus]